MKSRRKKERSARRRAPKPLGCAHCRLSFEIARAIHAHITKEAKVLPEAERINLHGTLMSLVDVMISIGERAGLTLGQMLDVFEENGRAQHDTATVMPKGSFPAPGGDA